MGHQIRDSLVSMDAWISTVGSEPVAEVTQVEVTQWRQALASSIEQLDSLAQAAQAAIDAYLLRSSASPRNTGAARAGRRQLAQEHMKRFSAAMAALEQEVRSIRR